jgi:adenylyltransferase/sulfurtransferase
MRFFFSKLAFFLLNICSMIDFKRFDRQLKLGEIGEGVQEKWWNARVMVVGVGGLGCGIIQGLVGAGVGHIALLDGDTVALDNLHRQWIFSESDVGKYKVNVAADWIKARHSGIEVQPIAAFLTADNAETMLSGFDLWIDGTDVPSAKLILDRNAELLDTPWVFGAVEQWDGQVSVLNFFDADGRKANYRDFFSSRVSNDMVGSCQQRGVMGPVVQMVAMMQVMEALRILGNLSPLYVGKMFCWDGWHSKAYSVSLWE